ncbi:MAG TPA: hypothetical protein PKD24_12945 [Pyrinomonadaceae bacterium]|nr:hypothetical protein [Pyrinomonadaceae bacterium]HMP65612.1 hypothetical protein [Pyrinomonadaceae bacterium]
MIFSLEFVIAGLFIASAAAYLGIKLARKVRFLGGDANCNLDCGCSKSDHGHIGSD